MLLELLQQSSSASCSRPSYRWPTAKAIVRHTWEKGKEYLKKMGGIILVASIIVWALGYYGPEGQASDMEQSYIGLMGQWISPLFSPQGFTWQLDVSLIAGVGAKEIVASTSVGGIQLSALRAALLPLHSHRRCHSPREWFVAMGRLRSSLYNPVGLGCLSRCLPVGQSVGNAGTRSRS